MTRDCEQLQLLIGGREHHDWLSYEIDSDLLTPADGWHVTLSSPAQQWPPEIVECARVEVRIGNETILIGYVDEIGHRIGKTIHSISLSGRDQAGDLLDCACPVFNRKYVEPEEILAAITHEFGIKKYGVRARSPRTLYKFCVTPGASAWDTLAAAAELNALWPWFEPDGTLMVGYPDYTAPVAASLVMKRSGKGNNVLSLDVHRSMHPRYSKVTVYGQVPGTDLEIAKHNLHAVSVDDGVLRNRPRIITDHDCGNISSCQDRARKELMDSRLAALTISAEVQGHRINLPDGPLWKPGQRIHVYSEPHNIDGVYFLMARKFVRSRTEGTRTLLTLKEDGMWLANDLPHNKVKHRINSVAGKIIDVG